MDDGVFDEWLERIRHLNRAQRRRTFQVLALAEAGDDEAAGVGAPGGGSEASIAHLAGSETGASPDPSPGLGLAEEQAIPASIVEAAAGKRVDIHGCPRCGSRRVQRWGHANGLARFRCGDCRRTFNGLTGTPLARLRKKEHWQDQAAALQAGETVAKAAGRCGVAYTTAFRWRHRFLTAAAADKPNRLSGIVEADEMFILESFKGKRDGLPRKARKRGGKASKRGLSAEQIPVLVARDRGGATIDAVLPKLDRASVAAVLDRVVTPDNQLCCDGGKPIVSFARRARIPCHILPAPGTPRPEAPAFHINNVNAYHGRFKEWARRFHGVATKYLDRYLGWRRTLEAIGSSAQSDRFILAAVGLGPYQHQTL